MTSGECRTKAVECYRAAQKAADYETRRALLDLVVQWRELASRMDRINVGNAPARPTVTRLH